MTTNSLSDALAIRAMASSFDAQRGKLPVPGDPHRLPGSIVVAQQISELGKLITELGDEVLFRTVNKEAGSRTTPAVSGFSAAVRYAGEAATALGEVGQQLAFLEQTEHLHEEPDARDAREAAGLVIDHRLETADTALREAADSLHAASTTVSPPSSRLRAALTRTTTPAYGAAPASLAPSASAPAPAARTVRGR
ncbi:hypothetical protein ROS62_11150 [Streptomyces sp. DSM 41972]|uniref:Uncharacterized protein n=1 Tax=Streptomyces althioticus subsp. attaecolombicae TaxID=3075534 RepID=A0ABU3HXK7_9ACTN|nr:hypothetical protein [Streptomyces sp. DSM 41972]SCD64838.1 hypothetical protein GA0115238_119234 [Streptomyces sp. di50b]SCD70001.1 hypothetical protein GA0115245_111750 [Streptomyces sp. di188]